jgi:polyketide biosynthesis enoyl-CoA hydratase PksI
MIMEIISIEQPVEGVAVLLMKDYEYRNTFTDEFVNRLMEKINELRNVDGLKCVIMRGLQDIFSAGASKDNLLQLCEGELSVKDLVLSEAVCHLPVPVIAAMEGGALGGGFVLGLCCDIVIMAERSMYGVNFTSLGFTPGMGCTRLLQELVGPYIAQEMMYTGKMYKGRTFKNRGLVNYILPADEVFPRALSLAEIIAEKPGKTLEILKSSLGLKKRKLLMEARLHEDYMHRISFANPEVKEIIHMVYNEVKKTEEKTTNTTNKDNT